ncbi:LysR family transcriptional regulator [Yoonia sediminilitoris]|uniref:DNA-binding transcriptional LysR family regulator n=1 Tax=Yoonia sediminilitoris TaxID=1286148 RepID=A0A2T6KLK6_9RHOB|nr:LysR family transcriptional regulator [Yoonia sediminilitoris]PUB17089.1 DNA-binding transcriptional LysR family regulator [Yoonia sediminilitoris]RCW97384.1 DNA-binding transcriptional LysR family regulator [Yoonia sediminilitoris]
MLYLTLRQYEYIVGVADAGSLTKAAALMNISQPSLSVAITRVEDHLKRAIFVRGKGAAIEITPYGHRLIAKARDLLALGAEIEQDSDTSHTWVLGCFSDIAPWYLAPALKQLGDRFPMLSFAGREGRFADLAGYLAEGQMDFAISYDVGFAGHFKRRKLADIAPVAFVATDHPLAQKVALDLSDLNNETLILFTENLSEEFMRDLFARVQLTPVIGQKVASLEMMRSLAANGAGVGISYSCPPGDLSYDGKRLVTVPIATPEAKTEIALIWSSLRAESPDFNAILNTLSPKATSATDSRG